MTENEKVRQYLIELLDAKGTEFGAKKTYLVTEIRLVGYDVRLIDSELRTLTAMQMVRHDIDDLGVEKWCITERGKRYLEA